MFRNSKNEGLTKIAPAVAENNAVASGNGTSITVAASADTAAVENQQPVQDLDTSSGLVKRYQNDVGADHGRMYHQLRAMASEQQPKSLANVTQQKPTEISEHPLTNQPLMHDQRNADERKL
ncbi:unnamed protein product [Phytophthora fragariaefolia]|uniref:Unnamed protein product n=1 Tax=Phytophthora fragariaefolia TaxID=1490495 RepID=A0A9W7D0W6_9STRA|nr:unnamed protein product [Phytophthora fragariaefolia]